jgi:hypothetical protein
MRALFRLTALTVALLSNIPSSQTSEGSWCASVNIGSGTEVQNCSMRSFEMCRREVIAGNRGSCFPNPRWPSFALQRRRAHN